MDTDTPQPPSENHDLPGGPEISAGKEVGPVEYILADVLPGPPEVSIPDGLAGAWARHLTDDERLIVLKLRGMTWMRGTIDSPEIDPDPATEMSPARIRRAVRRLLSIGAVWRIEAQGGAAGPPVYRLNPFWGRLFEEL